MFNLLEEYGLSDAAENGKWFYLDPEPADGEAAIPDEKRPRIKIRSNQSAAFEKAMTKLSSDNQEAYERSDMERMRMMGLTALGQTLIVGWENLSLNGEEEVVYSTNAAMKLVRNDKLKPLRDKIQNWAGELAQFKEAADIELKNSQATTSPSSTSEKD